MISTTLYSKKGRNMSTIMWEREESNGQNTEELMVKWHCLTQCCNINHGWGRGCELDIVFWTWEGYFTIKLLQFVHVHKTSKGLALSTLHHGKVKISRGPHLLGDRINPDKGKARCFSQWYSHWNMLQALASSQMHVIKDNPDETQWVTYGKRYENKETGREEEGL